MKKLLTLLSALAAVGCEVLEEDISGTQVQIIAPADRVSVEVGTVDFRWTAVEYATGYEFAVVSPSFSAARRVVADTVIYADTLARHFGCRLMLGEGEYEWSVTGFNGGYRTRTEVRSLAVMPTEYAEPTAEADDPDSANKLSSQPVNP